MRANFEELLLNAHRSPRASSPPPRNLYKRLKFIARALHHASASESEAPRQLLWTGDGGDIVAHRLGSETVIGRDPACDIVLENPRVSRRHCAIHRTGTNDELVDLKSRSGTHVNGVCIGRRVLVDGDMIELGGMPLVYANAPAGRKASAVFLER